jgi:uncharacterized protein (DUF305 family)
MTFSISRLISAMILTILGLSLATGGTLAAGETPTPDPHHSVQTTPTAQGGPCDAAAAATPTSHGMMSGGMMSGSPTSGGMHEDFDLMFIDMMIPHHEAAVAMAQVALVRGEHPEIRALAQEIIQSQGTEIALMKVWRDEWYPGAVAMPMDQMVVTMRGMMNSSTATMMGGAIGMTATMDPAGEAQALCSVTGSFDEAFIQMMIPHHESAVAMGNVAQQQATHSDLSAMAKGLVFSQSAEIEQMKTWLASWYGATPTAG